VIDAIARDCRSAIKKGKSKDTGKGTPASFLQKMEVCLERIVDESWERGVPEHKVCFRNFSTSLSSLYRDPLMF
jgi:hypothetical protein